MLLSHFMEDIVHIEVTIENVERDAEEIKQFKLKRSEYGF
jgi:hypothetical protein